MEKPESAREQATQDNTHNRGENMNQEKTPRETEKSMINNKEKQEKILSVMTGLNSKQLISSEENRS